MNNNYTPLVSICIPTFNGAQFIAYALNSVLKQTYGNIELIISDDESSDNTSLLAEKVLERSNMPVKMLINKRMGIGANWNNCIESADGKYLKFLFQDDLLHPQCIEKMVDMAESDPEIGMVYCRREIISEPDSDYQDWVKTYGLLHHHWREIRVATGIIDGRKYLRDPALLDKPLNKFGEPTAVLLRSAIFEKVGLFNTELKQTLDFEFWIRVMKYYKVGFIDEELVSFRLHKDQMSQINSRAKHDEWDMFTKLVYKNVFWQIDKRIAWELFKKESRLGSFIRALKNRLL